MFKNGSTPSIHASLRASLTESEKVETEKGGFSLPKTRVSQFLAVAQNRNRKEELKT
jgi:hypothetical protein